MKKLWKIWKFEIIGLVGHFIQSEGCEVDPTVAGLKHISHIPTYFTSHNHNEIRFGNINNKLFSVNS